MRRNPGRDTMAVLCMALPLWLASMHGAHAQATSGTMMPEALKHIKRAPLACAAAAPASAAGHEAGMPAIDPDFSCGASVPDVHKLLSRPDTQVVDLRLPAEFTAFHINGAVNLRAEEMHIKPYWKNKAIVLVGDGKGEADLYRECRRLKQSGYKDVRVMRGGMAGWIGYAQPVVGTAPSASSLTGLSAVDLWREVQSDGSVVLIDPALSAIKPLIGGKVLSKMEVAAFSSTMAQVVKRRKEQPVSGIVLVTKPGADERLVARLQQEAMPLPLLVYAGTAEAYRHALATQKAVWKARAQGPKAPACGW